jgi:hypothetical protein
MLDFQEGPIAKIEVRGEEVAVGRDPYTCKCIVFRFSDGMLLIEKILPERPERPDVLSLSTRNILRLGTICNLRQGLSIEDVRQLYQDCVFSLLNSPKFVATKFFFNASDIQIVRFPHRTSASCGAR